MELEPESYYVPMDNESARVFPFVRLVDLETHGKLSLVSGSHSSKEWASILLNFLREHGLLVGSAADLDDAGAAEFVSSSDTQREDPSASISGLSFVQREEALRDPTGSNEFFGGDSTSHSLVSLSSASVLWKKFRPRDLWNQELPYHPEAAWFPHMDSAYKSYRALHDSFTQVLEQLPRSFDALQTKLEENTVSYRDFTTQAVQPVKRLMAQFEDLSLATLGDSDGVYSPSAFWAGDGSLADYVESLGERLQSMEERFNSSASASVLVQMRDLAARVGEGMLATSTRAVQAEHQLEARIAALEQCMASAQPSVGVASDPAAVFASSFQGLGTNSSLPVASSSSDILGRVDGADISLTALVSLIRDLESSKLELLREIEKLKSSAYSAGVKVGGISFDSIDDLVRQLQADGVDPKSFATHVDHNSLFVHFADGATQTGENSAELKLLRAAGVNDPVCLWYLATFKQEHPVYLQDGGGAVGIDDRFPMLKDKSAWEGRTVLNGGRARLKSAVKDAYTLAKVYIADHLPAGSITRELANTCAQLSYEWWIAACTHLDDEILALGQFGILEKDVFGLVSDEIKIMFRQSFIERMKMKTFSEDRDPLVFYANCIWITMKAHMVMAEFSDIGFGSHVLISSLFTRFLAEQTGANLGAGVSAHIARLEAEIKKLRNELASKANAINGRLDKMDPKIKDLYTKCDRS